MTFRILDRSTPPPGGWRHVENGRVFEHYSRDTFFNAIRDYRLARGIPIEPDWQLEIEDEMCQEHAAEWGRSVCGRTEHLGERQPISLAAMQSFLTTMGSWTVDTIAKGKAAFVDREEAERRAKICLTCPMNTDSIGGCPGCVDKVMRALTGVIGRRSTPYDDKLGSCAVCSCSLAAAIWIPLKPQRAGLSEDLKAQFRAIKFCWKNEDETD